ncbi:MAG TPA: pyridoxamine 5'-phosphate oxidase family protein [Chloroflexota bacterium]
MTRSLGNQLPDSIRQLLDGSQLAEREGLTFLLLTNDEDNWPQVAMLSVGEVVAVDARSLRAGLWLHSGSSNNLTRSGQATLVTVANGNGYYVRLSAERGADLDLGSEGRLAYFTLRVEDVQEDSTEYASLTSGVTFALKYPDQVVPRWQHTVDALRAAP